MIQAYYKYRPASYEALALLVCADGKDRVTQEYIADMLRLLASARYANLPHLTDIIHRKPKAKMTAGKANNFVDNMLRTFRKGGKK